MPWAEAVAVAVAEAVPEVRAASRAAASCRSSATINDRTATVQRVTRPLLKYFALLGSLKVALMNTSSAAAFEMTNAAALLLK